MSVSLRVSRRLAIVVGTAGLAAVAACDAGSGDDSDVDTRPPSDSSRDASATPDTDAVLVDTTIAASTAAWRIAEASGRADLAAVHLAHVEALGGEIDVRPARRTVDRSTLVRREEQLQTQLVDASMAADSGELARLLASMSAAIAQQVVVL
ncbi:MAG: hypothetical protein WBP61_15285 [Nocardioides sp.]